MSSGNPIPMFRKCLLSELTKGTRTRPGRVFVTCCFNNCSCATVHLLRGDLWILRTLACLGNLCFAANPSCVFLINFQREMRIQKTIRTEGGLTFGDEGDEGERTAQNDTLRVLSITALAYKVRCLNCDSYERVVELKSRVAWEIDLAEHGKLAGYSVLAEGREIARCYRVRRNSDGK